MTELSDLGHYRADARLGGGRYVDVYQATDTVRRRMVALKVLKIASLPGELSLSRLLEQAQLASDLIHPHIAWIWETGETSGIYYLAERFVDGNTLAQVIAESGPLPWEEALSVIQQIAQGLDFAHNRGWVHGDVKPQNILLNPDLGAVLTDFGLMRGLQTATFPPGDGPPISTACYTSPEVWEGSLFTNAADQYALACIFVEALTGQVLFEAPTTLEIMSRHMAQLQLPQAWPVEVPWNLSTTLERALAKSPAERYASVGEFVVALEELVTEAVQDPDGLAQRRAETQAWHQAQEQARQQAEEAARQAALVQARREIQEQLRLETDVHLHEQVAAPRGAPESGVIGVGEQGALIQRRRRKERRQNQRRWLIWLGLGVLIAALAGFWMSGALPSGFLVLDTLTPTALPPTDTLFPTLTKTSTATNTATLMPTATFTHTVTLTHTPKQTPTPTITPANSPTSTRTRTPTPASRDRDTRIDIAR